MRVSVYRPAVFDDEGEQLDPEGWDDLTFIEWGLTPVSKQDSNGEWRYHSQTIALCRDNRGKVFLVDPEFITFVDKD
jgi:hypothetical protein